MDVKYRNATNLKYGLRKWADYVCDLEKCDPTSINNYDVIKDNIYYSSQSYLEESEECLAWSSNGDVDAKEEIRVSDLPKSGTFWKLMISFPPDFALESGLISKHDFYELTRYVLPAFFADAGLKIDNVSWLAALHRNTKNPHMHIAFYQKENIYTDNCIPEFALHNLRSNIANYLEDNREFYRDKALQFKNITGSISFEEFTKIKSPKFFDSKYRRELNEMLLQLYKKLERVNGRLQYNSKNMKPFKSEIDSIIKYILNHDSIKYNYAEYDVLLQKHQQKLIQMYGETKDNKTQKYYREQIKKLYSKIGNDILKNFKAYQSADFLERQVKFLSKNINKMNFKSRSDYAKETTKMEIAKGLYKLCKMSGCDDFQTKNIIFNWVARSKYNLDVSNLMDIFKSESSGMDKMEFYKTLNRLGYSIEKYTKLKNKNFYRELNYKRFFNNALNHIMYQVAKEEKSLDVDLRFELNNRF